MPETGESQVSPAPHVFREGWDAFNEQGRRRSTGRTPYDYGSPEWAAWWDGYTDAEREHIKELNGSAFKTIWRVVDLAGTSRSGDLHTLEDARAVLARLAASDDLPSWGIGPFRIQTTTLAWIDVEADA